MADTFNARSQLSVGTQAYELFHLDALSKRHALGKLPFSLKILLENLLFVICLDHQNENQILQS